MPSGFFFSADEDEQLAVLNSDFWESLIEHIRSDPWARPPSSVLDIGCHYGGLLSRLAAVWKPDRVWGIEPMAPARDRAKARVASLAPEARILDVTEWSTVPNSAFDLITCHEVLYLEPDLTGFMVNIRRALSSSGRAYVVLGCHAENPIWPHWKPQLEALGHRVYDHRPMDILAAAATLGLLPSVRPLRQTGWVTYDPLRSELGFPSVNVLLDHHFKYKLLFRFMRT